ncbi:MAG: conjugal transfer protein TraH [Rickettsiaceae bacterium]|nr:conjugal transfer protein TraH [Rickettsiaceae bacterium]
MKAVPGAAGAYALKMLIKEVCPQCEDIATYLETVARDINGLSVEQCAMAKSIAQGGLAMLNSASQQRCMMKSNILSASSDMFEATENCTDNPDRYGESGDEDQLKSLLVDNFNLVWKALSQGDHTAKTGLKELMMSISGSVIGRKEDGVMSLSSLPSLVEKEDLIERYIGKPGGQSGEVVIYRCDENTKCLNPTEQNEVLNSDQTLYGNVTTLLESIVEKVYENEGELSDDEQALIEFSSIPLINIIELELATKTKSSAASLVGMHEFVEVVCYDLITNYMQKMLTQAKSSVEVLKTAQLDNTAIDKFTQNVDTVRSYLRDKRFEAFKKLQVITQVKERLIQQQGVFELSFSRFMDTRGI